MLSRTTEKRKVARGALAGLALGLLVLAGLAAWSMVNTRHATDDVRDVNRFREAWSGVFQQVDVEDSAMHEYAHAGSESSRKGLAAVVGSAADELQWIKRHGNADDALAASLVEVTYGTYTATLREVLALGARGDDADLEHATEMADLHAASIRMQIAASIDRRGLETTHRVNEAERTNQLLIIGSSVTAAVDLALLMWCSLVLLGYQRRVERQAAQSRSERDTVRALAAATKRDEVVGAALTACLGKAPFGSAAVVGLMTESKLQLSGKGDWAAGEAHDSHRVEIADLPDAVAAALISRDCVLLAGEEATEVATRLRLAPSPQFMLAPLFVQRESFGMLILALDRLPPTDLHAALTTLAYEVASTLDKLRVSERLRVIVDHSSDLLFLASDEGVIRFANPAAVAAIGQPATALIGSDLRALIHPDDQADGFAAIEASASRTTTTCRLRCGDGDWFEAEMIVGQVREHDGSVSLVLNARDVSDRHRLEVELRHAQKLESVGRLAAGIAHEINTPVQFVGDNVRFLESSFADLLRLREACNFVLDAATEPARLPAAVDAVRNLENDLDMDFVVEEIPGAIKQTLDGVDRVATIVRAMKAFGYTNNDEKALVDLNEAIKNTLVVANSELKYVADVETDLADLPPVWCHIGDVNQVVLNLVVNAAHAIAASGRDRGTIRVNTSVDNGHAVIEVADSGTGIPPDVADKVFEAFFTTKEVGTGTGQGLALCRSLIVDRHGGTIDFTTEPGVGTTFTVRLPMASEVYQQPASAPEAERAKATT